MTQVTKEKSEIKKSLVVVCSVLFSVGPLCKLLKERIIGILISFG